MKVLPGTTTQKNMADKQNKNYTVRLNFTNEEDFENFKKAETLLIMDGLNIVDVIAFKAKSIVVSNEYILTDREIVDGENLRLEAERRFSKTITRGQLLSLRNSEWTDGKEYFSAPNGKMRAFRYDLEKCLPTIGEMLK